jgi:sec-independent protein translocase protein TatA
MRIGPFGLPELLLILLVILLIFGARRLPELGSSLGRGLRAFKSSISGDDERGQTKEPAASTRKSNDPPY